MYMGPIKGQWTSVNMYDNIKVSRFTEHVFHMFHTKILI